MQAYYIILQDRVLLSHTAYGSWQDIQADYPDYVTSLGPWTKAELLDYLQDDFQSEANWPLTRANIDGFYAGP